MGAMAAVPDSMADRSSRAYGIILLNGLALFA